MTIWRPTVAEVDLDAIRENCKALLGHTRGATKGLAVVKANGYGHGDVAVARASLEAGATWLGVALVEEGARLREAGVDAPILLLVEATPEAAKEIVFRELTPSVFTRAGAAALADAASAAGKTIGVHVCVDTGMHREGAPDDEAVELALYTDRLPNLEVEGLWSHLAVADERGHPFTDRQIERFAEVCGRIERSGLEVPLRHLANSAATIAHPDAHHDMVRMGIALYGLYPEPWMREACSLSPAMRLVSQVGAVRRVRAGEGISYGLEYAPERDTSIACVLIGYGDGYPRQLTNRGEILVGGRRRRIAGRVTMDQTMVDLNGGDDVRTGDEAVLIGRQGDEEVTAGELAELIGTIHYEIVCNISSRVPRVPAR